MAPNTLIDTTRFLEKKKEKVRIRFLACDKAYGIDTFPQMVIRMSYCPRCFLGRQSNELLIEFHCSPTARANNTLLYS